MWESFVELMLPALMQGQPPPIKMLMDNAPCSRSRSRWFRLACCDQVDRNPWLICARKHASSMKIYPLRLTFHLKTFGGSCIRSVAKVAEEFGKKINNNVLQRGFIILYRFGTWKFSACEINAIRVSLRYDLVMSFNEDTGECDLRR